MWLYTVDGFYSAVQDRVNPGIIMARARELEDLERMILRLNRAGHWPGVTIMTTTGTDYAFRVFIPRETWELYVRLVTSAIDYDNFKLRATPEYDDRHEAYQRVWEIMAAWQEGQIKPRIWRPSFSRNFQVDSSEYQDGDIFEPLAEYNEDDPGPFVSEPTDAVRVVQVTASLLKDGATFEEIADRLLELYDENDLKAALGITNDVVISDTVARVLDMLADPQVDIDIEYPPDHGTYDEFLADLAFDADRERRYFGR